MTTPAAERLERVRESVARAARAAGREPGAVRIVAVGKTFPAPALEEVHRCGQRDFGENRVQEARAKAAALPRDIRWHLIGHLQSNKAAPAVEIFDVIQSIDSPRLARRLESLAAAAGRRVEGLVQVDLAGEATKHGLPAGDVPALLEEARGFRALAVRGLMLLPPYREDPEEIRPFFRRLRELAEGMARRGLLAAEPELSMGMSHDFEVAVQEGATIVRIGTAVFGERGGVEDPAADTPGGNA